MDKTCEHCRFWGRDDDGNAVQAPHTEGLHYFEAFQRNEGHCDTSGWRSCWRVGDTGTRFVVTAADEYELALVTAAGFGCVEWQPHSIS